MLKLLIGSEEQYDEVNNLFLTVGGTVVELEHSLVSLSKWESKFQKPFLSTKDKTVEQLLWYIESMVVSKDFDPDILKNLNSKNIEEIDAYINSPQTATTFSEDRGRKSASEIITSELIYYWMTAFTIPFECQYWHLNRLLTLIKVCNAKNGKPKKMSKKEIVEKNRQLNEQRRAQLGTSG